MGIEKTTGVNAASPISPYLRHILTILRERRVKIFFGGIWLSMYW